MRPLLKPLQPLLPHARLLLYFALIVLAVPGCGSAADDAAKIKTTTLRTDSILSSLHRATRYIDSARNLLAAKDSAGGDQHLAAMLLVHTALGDSIRSSIRALIDCCHSAWPNPATAVNIDNAFHSTKTYISPDFWYDRDFIGTPTVTAYTLLTTIRDECTGAANFAVAAIGGRPH
ncbi:MAG TPA: hypothetical protein VHE54_19435 [Puia sp.]|nr:hypothetical protein [Puia sp.]